MTVEMINAMMDATNVDPLILHILPPSTITPRIEANNAMPTL
jgi:hypothetical protein